MSNVRPHIMPRAPTIDLLYAIVAKHSNKLQLLATIRRKGTDIYLLFPHDRNGSRLDDGTEWNPHVSYHASGQHHVKTYNQFIVSPDQRQPPDAAFAGSEPYFDLGLGQGDWARRPEVSDPTRYAEFFTISADELNSADYYLLSLHIIARDGAPSHRPYCASPVAEHIFRGLSPWIHTSLWRMQLPVAAQ